MINTSKTLIKKTSLEATIKRLLLIKNLSDDDISYMRKCSLELIQLTNHEDAKSYIFLGRANLLANYYKQAKRCFRKAIRLNSSLASSYHGLFKIAIIEEDYPLAYSYINKYGVLSGIDVSIYKSLLLKINENSDIIIPSSEEVLGQRHLYKPLRTNYKLLIDAINSNNFDKAYKHVQVCIKLVKEQGYHLDLSYLERLVITLKNKMSLEQTNSEKKELQNIVATSDNLGHMYMLLIKLHELDPMDINNLYMLIEISIAFENYEQARIYLNKAYKINPDSKRIQYYDALLREKNIGIDEFIKYMRKRLQLNELVKNRKYPEAINVCIENINTNSYFLYMIGVILFKVGSYSEAKRVFMKYLTANCTSELKEIYYYMFYIDYSLENNGYLMFARKAFELSSFDGIDVSLDSFISYLLSLDTFDSSNIKDIEQKLFVGKMNINTPKCYVNIKQEII